MQTIPNTFSHSDTMTYLPPKTGRYIVFDTETTGLEPKENNIIEIAGIEIMNGKLTGNQFHAFFCPRYKISETAEEKQELAQSLTENGKIKEQELLEQYDVDIFRNNKKVQNTETVKPTEQNTEQTTLEVKQNYNETALVEKKESAFKKFFNKLKGLFKRK